MRNLLFVALIALTSCSKSVNLFNGKDLTGWDTYLKRTGLNNDPDKVFSVAEVDGKPAIKISGEYFGGISTVEQFSNYHLTVQFKWGEKKYAPKLNAVRDSGLLYHAVGEHGADGGNWMKSQEFQVEEGNCGDYWGCAGGAFEIPVIQEGKEYIYNPSGVLTSFSEDTPAGRHVVKSPDNEKPTGQWNTLELYTFGDSAVHVVNGKVVMRLYKSNIKAGKIQIQSEGAEVYYRNFQIEKISKMPASTL
jgi:hypothetical protein